VRRARDDGGPRVGDGHLRHLRNRERVDRVLEADLSGLAPTGQLIARFLRVPRSLPQDSSTEWRRSASGIAMQAPDGARPDTGERKH
jgi:hypothetical protein